MLVLSLIETGKDYEAIPFRALFVLVGEGAGPAAGGPSAFVIETGAFAWP